MVVNSVDEAERKKIITDGLMVVAGVFLLALCYNLLLVPNNFAFSGMSGVGIIVNKYMLKEITCLLYYNIV